MEHKPSKASFIRRPIKQPEPYHWCGNCQNYTESWQDDQEQWHWSEHCYAGCTYEHMRHTLQCDKWVQKEYNYV